VLARAEKFETVADAIADCTLIVGTTAIGHRQLQHPLHVLKDGALSIQQVLNAPPGDQSRVAILFGSEKFGLSNEDLSHCHWLMHIPTSQEQKSMNLGQAVAVCLYEISRETTILFPSTETAPASAAELERVTALLLDTLRESDYIDDQSSESRMEIIRRMVRRMRMSTDDASLSLGMLRQILWKLRTKN
jgi:tRNA/rRNA methyltransferase